MSWRINVFGVRHLSPMGAWHLRSYLDRLRPAVVLIEGLDDATDLVADMTRKETRPPFAILAYTDALPVRTLVYPLAAYSPEYQAICWARLNKARVEFIDLPSERFLGLQDAEITRRESQRREWIARREESAPTLTSTGPAESEPPPDGVPEPKLSLYERFAAAAGERDYETYWERHFEHNTAENSYHGAILEFGQAVRELAEDSPRWRGKIWCAKPTCDGELPKPLELAFRPSASWRSLARFMRRC